MTFLLTWIAGAATGYVFTKCKIPGGMMVGALTGAMILNIGTDLAYMPRVARLIAQITAGAFIGATIRREDLRRIPALIKPAIVLLGGMLLLNLVMGIVIRAVSGLDWMTSFFCAVPGGMSDTPIIAAEVGANSAAVALMQFARLVFGVGVFPSVIMLLTRRETMPQRAAETADTARKKNGMSRSSVAATIAVSAACGIMGSRSGIPVGALTFSMAGTAIFHLMTNRASIPLWLKRMAQVLSGAYIGCSISLEELLSMRALLLPAILLVAGYMINCLALGSLLYRFCGMTRREVMLAATPAGASDMALISSDMGISNPDLNVLQVLRMITAVSVFPPIIRLLVARIT